jgi:rRNA-processing protein FCF1
MSERITETELDEIKSVYSLIIRKCLVKEIDEMKEGKKRLKMVDEILKIDSSLNELFL